MINDNVIWVSLENVFLSVSNNNNHEAYQLWMSRADMLLPSLESLALLYWKLWFGSKSKFDTCWFIALQPSERKLSEKYQNLIHPLRVNIKIALGWVDEESWRQNFSNLYTVFWDTRYFVIILPCTFWYLECFQNYSVVLFQKEFKRN